jgi:hypothetical protein
MGVMGCVAAAVAPAHAVAEKAQAGSSKGRPLLVIVETGPGVAWDAAHVRQAVRNELGIAITAPAASPASDIDVLLVTLDSERIVMTLRGHTDEQVTRVIPNPAESPAQLRAVAWLAGNIVRDQISPILSAGAMESTLTSPEPRVPVPAVPASAAIESAPMHASPVASSTEGGALGGLYASRSPSAPTAAMPRWTLTAAGGPTAMFGSGTGVPFAVDYSTAWQLEAQYHRSTSSLYGLAVDAGPNARHGLGAAAFAGSSWHPGRWTVEATAGAGVEAAMAMVASTEMRVSAIGATVDTVMTREARPALYARGMIAVGHPLTESLDLFLRAGAHVTAADLRDGLFVASSVGLRLRLP